MVPAGLRLRLQPQALGTGGAFCPTTLPRSWMVTDGSIVPREMRG
jgi:hypothetical protein